MVVFVAFLVTFTPLAGLFWMGIRSERIRLEKERRQLVTLTQWATRNRRFRRIQ